MKLVLSFKCPDVTDQALSELSDDDIDIAKEAIAKWVRYDEYVSIEIDTETNKAVVLPVR